MKAYSHDLRKRIIEALEAHEESHAEIAERFAVSQPFVEKSWQRWRRTGSCAPMTVAGAVNTAVFRTYVEQVLGPTLRPGDIVVWDNLAVHKVAGITKAMAAQGARLQPLPPYSPEPSPIEQCWAKLKTALRQARTRCRLDAALKRALQTITPADAQAWFTHCGNSVHP